MWDLGSARGAAWQACVGSGRLRIDCVPTFIQDTTQPQEDDQQEVMEKKVVYHNVSLPLGEIDDRLPASQAGDLSARWRYTTQGWSRTGDAPSVLLDSAAPSPPAVRLTLEDRRRRLNLISSSARATGAACRGTETPSEYRYAV
jgi:hypothetical protein